MLFRRKRDYILAVGACKKARLDCEHKGQKKANISYALARRNRLQPVLAASGFGFACCRTFNWPRMD